MIDSQAPRLVFGGNGEAGTPRSPVRLVPDRFDLPRPGQAHLISGDNLASLRCLAERIPGRVTLAYLDPPFLTGRTHSHVDRKMTESGIVRTTRTAFDDRWESMSHYLQAIKERLVLVHKLLSDEGCLVLHVDPKTSHYLKIICDEIFGIDAFASEVIWRYRRWPSKTRNFQRVHDVMLRYVKNPEANSRFNQLYEPLAASTQKTWGDRKQRAVVDAEGRRLKSSKSEEPTRGVPLGDVWEIGIVAPVAKERTGYPTQKPEALLRRWIEACTDPNDLVLDPYMGSGTTLQVACTLGRAAIGLDVGTEAHAVTRARLEKAKIKHQSSSVVLPLARATASAATASAATASAQPGTRKRDNEMADDSKSGVASSSSARIAI